VKGATGGNSIWSQTSSFAIPVKDPEMNKEIGLKVTLYPNPGTGEEINVFLSSEESGRINLSLFEISGKMLYQKGIDYNAIAPAMVTIPANDLRVGMYFVCIQCASGSILKKLVIH